MSNRRRVHIWDFSELGSAGVLVLCLSFFVAGIFLGFLASALMNQDHFSGLSEFLPVLAGTADGTAGLDLFSVLPLFWSYFRWVLIALLLSLSGLGLILLPLMLAARGFLLAFSFSALVQTSGLTGLAGAAAIFIPVFLLTIPPLLYFAWTGVARALRGMHRLAGGRYLEWMLSPAGSAVPAAVSACGLFGCVFIEWIFVPKLVAWLCAFHS